MKRIRVAINGFGRIGRVAMRCLLADPSIVVVAINDLGDLKTLTHLFKYDSVHRTFPGTVRSEAGNMIVDGHAIKVLSEAEPSKLPWDSLNIDLVIESTGRFRTEALAGQHLEAGAKQVIISAPATEGEVKTIVMGINDGILDGTERIVSNASCTTNSAAPLVDVLQSLSEIESAYITTVHSYTTDQKLHDTLHKDLRRARAAATSIVPTTTGAAKAITRIFPDLDGKIGGCGIRVPVPNGSLTDLTVTLKDDVSQEEVNNAFRQAAEGPLKGILQYEEDPIVSVDIIGNPNSCIFDAQLTSSIGKMVKVVGWYDNEMGYSNRLVDLIHKLNP